MIKTMEKELTDELELELAREVKLEERTNEAFFIEWVKIVVSKLDNNIKLAS